MLIGLLLMVGGLFMMYWGYQGLQGNTVNKLTGGLAAAAGAASPITNPGGGGASSTI